ncbi:MAG: glycosyltransferase [Oscillospiraceae bacterium]
MEILYISSVPSPNEFYRIKETIKDGIDVTTYGMNESGFKFHTLIMDGLCEKEDVNVLSLVGRSVSSKTHSGLLWKTKKEKTKTNLSCKHLGFLNIPILKQIGLGVSFFFNTLSWVYKNRGKEKYIIMDAAYVTVIPFVLFASNFGNCKTSAIFCDIYEYMARVKDARDNDDVSFIRKIARWNTVRNYKRLDSFILLTEQMNSVVNLLNKPFIVIEGLVDIDMQSTENRLSDKEPGNIIMYAGALREQYGLKNLIEGFINYKNCNASLWIFGAGDYSSSIVEAESVDSRIQFFGSINLDEVIKNEQKASLLINPRSADKEFTKYSFPSKNMEYMVSGTPILTTKLPGMPIEYYDYVYLIDGNSANDITRALEKVFQQTKEQIHQKGLEAREFVLKNKNNVIQAKRIIDLLETNNIIREKKSL